MLCTYDARKLWRCYRQSYEQGCGQLVAVSSAMVIGVSFCGFFCVMLRVKTVTMSYVGVMSSLFMVAFFVMSRSFAMVLDSVLQMFGSLAMMLNAFRHKFFSE
jgi:hypothetical protein